MSVVLATILLAGCEVPAERDFEGDPLFTLSSAAFDDGALMPPRYTCDGEDTTPPLSFAGLPADATHVALIMDDPGAPMGTWTHWTFWDLPVEAAADLVAGTDVTGRGAVEGENTWGRTGYGGPCPPDGMHHYVFHAFATVGPVGLPEGAPAEEAWAVLGDAAIAKTTLTGTYQRI